MQNKQSDFLIKVAHCNTACKAVTGKYFYMLSVRLFLENILYDRFASVVDIHHKKYFFEKLVLVI